MDYDASWLLMGSTTLLLNLIGFLIFSAVALCTTPSWGDGGPSPSHSCRYLSLEGAEA